MTGGLSGRTHRPRQESIDRILDDTPGYIREARERHAEEAHRVVILAVYEANSASRMERIVNVVTMLLLVGALISGAVVVIGIVISGVSP